MKHVLTIEESDILDYIEKMLALSGVAPAEPLRLSKNEEDRYEVTVVCKDISIPKECPLCGRSEAPAPVATPVAEVPAPMPLLVMPPVPSSTPAAAATMPLTASVLVMPPDLSTAEMQAQIANAAATEVLSDAARKERNTRLRNEATAAILAGPGEAASASVHLAARESLTPPRDIVSLPTAKQIAIIKGTGEGDGGASKEEMNEDTGAILGLMTSNKRLIQQREQELPASRRRRRT